MTLIEVLVALAIIALIMAGGIGAFRRVSKSDLREEASRVSAALRFAFDRAAGTAAHHRVVFDLDGEAFVVERCEGRVTLRRGLEAHRDEMLDQIRAALAASPGAQVMTVADAPPPGRVGAAECAPVKGAQGKRHTFRSRGGLGIARAFVAHHDGPVDEGMVTVNFFPTGRGERAVVEVTDAEENVYSISLEGLTGRVRLREGAFARPEEFVRRAGGSK